MFTKVSAPTPALATLPPELLLHIFSLLDKCSSTCLGITAKNFYAVHKATHGTVSLGSRNGLPCLGKKSTLFELLREWMGDRMDRRALKMWTRWTEATAKVEESLGVVVFDDGSWGIKPRECPDYWVTKGTVGETGGGYWVLSNGCWRLKRAEDTELS